MDKFAKLYEHDKIGQILVMKSTNEDEYPMLKFIMLHEGVEVSAGPSYEDSDAGWDLLDLAFNLVDEENAVEFASGVFATIGGKL